MKSEKRLIDANALKRKFDEREADDVELYGCVIVECFPADDAKEIVDQMPTVDAAEVMHGRWIWGESNHIEWMKCSECLKSQTPNLCFTYCPNCGATMDGGNEE